MEQLITKYLENFKAVDKGSVEYYAETGKVRGSLYYAIKSIINETLNKRDNAKMD